MLKTLGRLAAVCAIFPALTAAAFEAGGGGGIVTLGDDRRIPAAHVWMQQSRVTLAATFTGEKNSSFAQQTSYAHLSFSAQAAKNKTLWASLGVGGIYARTQLKQDPNASLSIQKNSLSAGLAMGLRWAPQITRDLRFRISWDSLFVPPGESVRYLTFGHMQSLTTGMGWEF